MSFILDALKKSESDRQRQSGPALYEVKVAPPRTHFPLWAIAIVALLAINMIVVGWILARKLTSHGDETAAAAAAPASGGNTAGSSTNNPTMAANSRPSQSGNYAPSQGTYGNPPANYGTAPANYGGPPPNYGSQPGAYGGPSNSAPPPNNGWSNGLSGQWINGNWVPNNPAQQSQQPVQPQQPGANQYGPSPPPAPNQSYRQGYQPPSNESGEPTLANNTRGANGMNNAPPESEAPAPNPDDYAPASDPGNPLFKGHVKRGTESGIPLYQDVATQPGAALPQLRLDLHVYAAKAQDRFALINMHRSHEGDSLPEGVKVEAITPDGVVLSHNGTKFLLPRD